MKLINLLIASSLSGMHNSAGIFIDDVFSASVSSGSPMLPSPISISHDEKRWTRNVCLKSPSSIMLLPPNKMCGLSKMSLSNDAIPEDTTANTILSSKRRTHAMDFHRKSCLSHRDRSDTSQKIRTYTQSFLSSSDKACKEASSNASIHSGSPPIRPRASHAALFVGYTMSLTVRISQKDLQPF
nr:hypothetical protein [Tanacetum cinerariifolium]